MSEDDNLILRLAQRLAPEDPQAMLVELKQRDSFQGDLGWLRLLFSVADTMPQAPEDSDLRSLLHAIPLAELQRSVRDRPFEMAIQIHDSRDEGQLVGLRGSSYRNRDVWTVVFSAPSADLIIDGTPLNDGTTRLVGHFLPRSSEPARCQVMGDTLDRPVESDEDGRFVLDGVTSRSHRYQVASETTEIECTVRVTQT